jgi:hypothetical protein
MIKTKNVEDILEMPLACDDNWVYLSDAFPLINSVDPVFASWLLGKQDYIMREMINEMEETFTCQLADLQYLETETDEHDGIKLSDRITELGYISKEDFVKIYKSYNIGKIRLEHQDRTKVHQHIMQISKLINRDKKKRHGEYAKIRRAGRSNLYSRPDYEQFGDNIIRIYFQKKPFSSWSVEPDKTPTHILYKEYIKKLPVDELRLLLDEIYKLLS